MTNEDKTLSNRLMADTFRGLVNVIDARLEGEKVAHGPGLTPEAIDDLTTWKNLLEYQAKHYSPKPKGQDQ